MYYIMQYISNRHSSEDKYNAKITALCLKINCCKRSKNNKEQGGGGLRCRTTTIVDHKFVFTTQVKRNLYCGVSCVTIYRKIILPKQHDES